ncbi:MAG TPA: hypothetical protein VHL53_11330 [Acidimicrobiia bacterium]|nr:hypothetical protein [Acidimicrobiia bacterium]
MTKRLGMFLGLGFSGVVLLLGGLAWDAVVHAHDPSLAGREGIFTLRNPGHALMGLGIGLVLVGLIGAGETVLSSATGRWGRPGVRRAFLALSTAVVVVAAGITSWAGGAAHPAGHGQLAAAVDGAHGHDRAPAAEGPPATHDHDAAPAGGAAGTAGPGIAGHDHPATTQWHDPVAGTDDPAGHDHGAGAIQPGATGHDHGAGGPAAIEPGTAGNQAPGHDHSAGPAAGPDPSGPAAGGHDHGAGAAADAPQGTWTEVRYGPFVIPPAGAGGDADHADIAVPTMAKPCTNCFLLQLEPDLVYADGTPANLDTGMMLHHAVMFAAGRPDATCGPHEPFPGQLGQRFFASGNERTPFNFPPGFGYYVDSGSWSGIFHIMNHSTTAKSVYFTLRVRTSPAAAGGILPLTPVWLDMNNCRTSEYAVPAGPSSSHWQWTSNVTGRIVSTGGHVHNGGVRTTLTNATTGSQICTSWAGWGRNAAYQGSIESMSTCTWDRVGTVQKGEVLDLESVYNAARPVPDAMGIMMAFVYETADLGAGTPAPPAVRGEGPAPVESTPPPSGHDHH